MARLCSRRPVAWRVRSLTVQGAPVGLDTIRSSTTRPTDAPSLRSQTTRNGALRTVVKRFVGWRFGSREEYRTENDVLFSVPSPRVWPRAGPRRCRPGMQEAGRFGPLVLRLVRKDYHQQAGQVNCQMRAAAWSDRTNAPSLVRKRNLASTSAPSSVSHAERSKPHNRWACAVVSRRPGISMYSP